MQRLVPCKDGYDVPTFFFRDTTNSDDNFR